jgi:hypothetical protein
MYERQGDFATVKAYSAAYRSLMVDQVGPLEKRIMQRPATSWTHVVELAEVAWWGIAHRGDRYGDYPASVLAKAVLSLGGGERFYLHEEGKPERLRAS